ncbi:hypothetical protein N0V90_003744 [Kalmusia sp. IMI 367209]|nr:hypothetical protein N0V90_003744 [Kalmusia sp. IMI 367209]
MPTEEENIQYLYLVVTNSGPPQFDWPSVCKEVKLSQGAASKRWSRLKQAIEAGKPAGAGSLALLWLLVKHRTSDKIPDWKDIAQKCGTTPGAASKRFSRMKQAFDKGDPATPKGTAYDALDTAPATPTPKRKRAPAVTKKHMPKAEDTYKPAASNVEDEDVHERPKRARKAPAKQLTKKASTIECDTDALFPEVETFTQTEEFGQASLFPPKEPGEQGVSYEVQEYVEEDSSQDGFAQESECGDEAGTEVYAEEEWAE